MAMILGCSWHLDNKKEAHASFIRQCKSNMKDVALFLSVITTRFGFKHEELPVWCWWGVRQSAACGISPQENED